MLPFGSSGKPADVVEKMTEGRVRKFFQEVRLLGAFASFVASHTEVVNLSGKETASSHAACDFPC